MTTSFARALVHSNSSLFRPHFTRRQSKNAIGMEQDERAVVADLRDREKEEHGCQGPVPGGVAGAEGGLTREAVALSEQENITGGHGAAVSDEEEALTEESEVIAPVGNAGQGGVSLGCSQNEDHEMPTKGNPATTRYELRGFRPARRAIAHAMPPSSYRRLPLRSRKRSNPTRLIVVGDAASGVGHAYDLGTSEEEASGPPTSADGDNDEAIDSTRSRKQRRSDHFISDPEEAVSADRAKAHRSSNTAPDRFLASSVVASPPEQRPGWARRNTNITADGVRHQGQPGSEAFRAAPGGGGPEEPDGSATRVLVRADLHRWPANSLGSMRHAPEEVSNPNGSTSEFRKASHYGLKFIWSCSEAVKSFEF